MMCLERKPRCSFACHLHVTCMSGAQSFKSTLSLLPALSWSQMEWRDPWRRASWVWM